MAEKTSDPVAACAGTMPPLTAATRTTATKSASQLFDAAWIRCCMRLPPLGGLSCRLMLSHYRPALNKPRRSYVEIAKFLDLPASGSLASPALSRYNITVVIHAL